MCLTIIYVNRVHVFVNSFIRYIFTFLNNKINIPQQSAIKTPLEDSQKKRKTAHLKAKSCAPNRVKKYQNSI